MPYKDKEFGAQRIKILNKIKEDIVYSHYGSICNCCGESNRLFLTIDHINNDGHIYKTKSGNRWSVIRFYIDIIKRNFPKDIQILCMNCNFGKFKNKGICPHRAGQ